MKKLLPSLLLLLSAAMVGCSKNGSPGLPTPGSASGALLEKTETIAMTSQHIVQDSILTEYSYNTNKTVSEIQQTMFSQALGITLTSTETINFTYAGTLVSGMSETTNSQTSGIGVPSSTSNTVSTTIYHASGSQIISYATFVSVTSGINGGYSINTSTNDSATLAYNGNGQITQWNSYKTLPGSGNYLPYSTESFAYDGSNLSSYVDIVYPLTEYPNPAKMDTITAEFQHDSKTTSEGVFTIIPGIMFILNANDLSKLTISTVGYTPGVMTVNYNTTYNSANQPTISISTISTNPTTGIAAIDNGVTETTTYTYQ